MLAVWPNNKLTKNCLGPEGSQADLPQVLEVQGPYDPESSSIQNLFKEKNMFVLGPIFLLPFGPTAVSVVCTKEGANILIFSLITSTFVQKCNYFTLYETSFPCRIQWYHFLN